MLNIQRFVCNMFQENCYVINDETNECVIIDCGAFYEEEKKAIYDYVIKNKLTPKHLLCTHGHVDHNFGNGSIFDTFGLRPEFSRDDKPLMDTLNEQAKAFTGIDIAEKTITANRYLNDGDTIKSGNHIFKIIATPGHSPGSVVIYCEDEHLAFSGDTIFRMSIGRTDLALGDYEAMTRSLQHLKSTLPGDTVILPGHGGRTNMADEIKFNPFMK